MVQPVELTTERLTLRIPTAADIDALTAACQDPEIPRWTPVPSPYTREDAEQFVATTAENWRNETHLVWVVYAGSQLVASVGLHRLKKDPYGAIADIGFWSAREARGHGYVAEASRAIIDWAFNELGAARVEWHAVAGNVASAYTARSLGFHFEGVRRQVFGGPDGRDDGWMAALLPSDDRIPPVWPILED